MAARLPGDVMLRSVLIFAISAMFLGLGLGRFAFSPLIPELVGQGWLDVGAAQAIGAANLVGYFAGAISAKLSLRLISERRLCILAAALVVLSYGMFLLPFGMAWFWIARFLAGAGGAILMVVAMAAAGRQLIALDRARLQPMLFVGIGLGVFCAAVFMPHLLRYGMKTALLALTACSATALAALWITGGFLSHGRRPRAGGALRTAGFGRAVTLIILAYGCDALGFVMHTIYLPDLLRRTYGYTEGQVGLSWAFFGIGACSGPVFVMLLRRSLSALDALWLALAIKAAGVALAFVAFDPLVASLSLFLVGMLTPGMVILTSAALSTAATQDRYVGLWASATALFALCQMASGMTITAISGEGYGLSLVLSVAVLAVGAALAVTAKVDSHREEQQ